MRIEKLYVGGWFQRTTLHLSEMYDFFKEGTSPLALDTKKLEKLRNTLSLTQVDFHVGKLESVQVQNKAGVEVQIFEDGLILLAQQPQATIKRDIKALTTYYEQMLSPALSYLFSLGAPMPKELANIKTIYPYFVVVRDALPKDIKALLRQFGEKEHFTIERPEFGIYRGDKLYIIHAISVDRKEVEKFIVEQIFMREFKGQLHRYLNLHRLIWERIAEVKEKGEIKGKEVGALNASIESYSKTINLIDARMNQMGTYVRTREAIVKGDPAMQQFLEVLQFKHEALVDTLSYVKDIWKMTKNYVDSALQLFTAIQAKSTEASVKNLTIITSMGVGASLIGLFAQKTPEFTSFGVGYFFILAIVGYLANEGMKKVALNRMYKIKDADIAKDLK